MLMSRKEKNMDADRKRNGPQIYADFVTRINAYKGKQDRESAKISVGIGGNQRTIPNISHETRTKEH